MDQSKEFLVAFLYKGKKINIIPRSYIFRINEDKSDLVPMEDQDFWETPLSGDEFQYNNEEVY